MVDTGYAVPPPMIEQCPCAVLYLQPVHRHEKFAGINSVSRKYLFFVGVKWSA
jgi:hypothetical protein